MIKVAVIGVGYWGKNLLRNFNELGVLAAICDSNLNASHASQYSEIKQYSDYSECLNDTAIDAVAISTPAVMHYPMVKAALEAGKHVFVEKPICLSAKEGEQLAELANKQQKILMVGHLLQYHSAFKKLKSLCEDGLIGDIQYLYSNRLSLGKFRNEENVLWSFAPHDLSMLLSLTKQLPERVCAHGHSAKNNNIEDTVSVNLSFSNGVKGHVLVSWCHPFKEQRLVVQGTKGMLVFTDSAAPGEKLLFYPHQIDWKQDIPTIEKAEATPVEFEQAEPLLAECQHFVECIQDNLTPCTDAHEGIRVLKVLEASQASLDQNGETISLGEMMEQTDYFVHESSYVDDDVLIGNGSKIWHFSHVLKGSKIGKQCKIGQNVVIGPDAVIGNNVKIQNNVSVYQGVKLEDDVFCGPSMVFTNVHNPRSAIPRMDEVKDTLVKKGATIGANATIVCGNTIGQYAFIGAGAVITKDVPDYALMVGNPARQIGWMCHCGNKLVANDNGSYACPQCDRTYAESDKGLMLQS